MLVFDGSGDGDGGVAEPVGRERAGSVAALADCRDWNGGSVPEKMARVEQLRLAVSPSGADDPVLSDQDAFDVLEAQCEPEYAAGFRLYKIYARAAPFSQLQP